ncbi:WS/DGAT/MGAT family O-acyltransferase [Pseudonocardia sp.]|uniref:WS/DGAT/MGAT family O-acyltransferase n=1 Tax=Pseudonocardia sp. TaxID=60912 RepID=UPI003D1520F4
MDPLSPLDASFLYMERPTTAMHVGGLLIFDGDIDADAFARLIGARLAAVPRYRQKVREVPGWLGPPVWVDDPDFDLDYHVRRAALPGPGTEGQLRELAGRVMGRQLDRDRPLWEIYLVEGLTAPDGSPRFAVISKTHHAVVDGLGSIDIGAVLLDMTPEPRESPPDDWAPRPEPSSLGLMADALGTHLRRPWTALDTVGRAVTDLRAAVGQIASTTGAMLAAARSAGRGTPAHPLNAPISPHRRFATSAAELDDYKAVRKAHGGTVNDVVLAVVTGALRRWLEGRGEPVLRSTTVRAMVPVSVRARRGGRPAGNQISAVFVDLPVGDPDPVSRLATLSATMLAHKRSGQAVGATALVGLVGLTPPTLHSLTARLTSSLSSRVFNVVVTNVPGPQFPLYAMGARMVAMYPVVPLAQGQAVSIGITSYNGGVFYGLNADRDAMADADDLAVALETSLSELKETVP